MIATIELTLANEYFPSLFISYLKAALAVYAVLHGVLAVFLIYAALHAVFGSYAVSRYKHREGPFENFVIFF